MNEYFYKTFIPLAMKIKKKGLHDESSTELSLEGFVDGLRGGKKNSRLKTQHQKKRRGRQALKRFREPELGRFWLECWMWAGV